MKIQFYCQRNYMLGVIRTLKELLYIVIEQEIKAWSCIDKCKLKREAVQNNGSGKK